MIKEIKNAMKKEYHKSLIGCRLSIRYLQGVFDGDGSIEQVSMNSLVPLLFIETFLLAALKAPNSYRVKKGYTTKYMMDISNKTILDRLKLISPFRYNFDRKEKFYRIEAKQKQHRSKDMLVKLLNCLRNSKTLNQIYAEMQSECDQAVKRGVELGLILISGKGTKYEPYKFVISEKGRNFIENYEKERKNYIFNELEKIRRLVPA